MDARIPEYAGEIERVEAHMMRAADSESALLRDAAQYVASGGGKRVRARIMILVASAMGSVSDDVLRAAASIELLHAATLVHDDVIDQSAMRRGRPSANARFGDDVAILLADHLFAQSYELMLSALDAMAMRRLCRVSRKMCEAEAFQIAKRDQVLDEGDYYRIISSKTAELFSISASLGATWSGATQDRREALDRFGHHVGMAYQITDDVLDYAAQSSRWGKPVGNDLAQGKQTLPLVRTLALADASEREDLLAELRNGRRMSKVLPVIEKYRGLEYSREKAREFAQEAQKLTPDFAPEASRPLFDRLCRFAVERAY